MQNTQNAARLNPTTRNALKQLRFKWMDDDHNGNNIKMLINSNSKVNLFNQEISRSHDIRDFDI
jgi:hypothetical protein